MSEPEAKRLTEEEIKQRLLALPTHADYGIFSARCALRALPYIFESNGYLSLCTAFILSGYSSSIKLWVLYGYANSIVGNVVVSFSDSPQIENNPLLPLAPSIAYKTIWSEWTGNIRGARELSAQAVGVLLPFSYDDILLDINRLAQGDRLDKYPLWNYLPAGWNHDLERALKELHKVSPTAPDLIRGIISGAPDSEEITIWLSNWKSEYDDFLKYKDNKAAKIEEIKVNSIPTATADLKNIAAEDIAREDLLGREAITEALYRLLTERDSTQHFAIGLFGQWGAGKSSQLAQLKDKIAGSDFKDKLLIAEFNAWKNEKASNLGAMLAQAVVDGLTKDLGLSRRFELAVNLAIVQDSPWGRWQAGIVRMKLYGAMILFGVALFAVFSGINGSLGISNFLSENQKLLTQAGATTSLLYLLYLSITKFLTNRLSQLFVLSSTLTPSYREHLGLLGEIQKTLANLCELRLGTKNQTDGKHLLLIIDDLDRCSVNAVKEILDAVRLVADIPRLTTIVAIDERMAFAAVEKHYDQFGHAGRPPALVAREYLAKVLQASISLPERTETKAITHFVTKNLFKDTQEPNPELFDQIGDATEEGRPILPNQATSDLKTKSDVEEVMAAEAPPVPSKLPAMPKPLHEEKQLFCELIETYQFHNPRLMGRMYLAWRLIKGVLGKRLGAGEMSSAGEIAYTFADIENGLHLLFWREFCLQQEAKTRDSMEKWMRELGKGQAFDIKKCSTCKIANIEFTPEFLQQLWHMSQDKKWQDKEAVALINSVLLPPAPKMAEKK